MTTAAAPLVARATTRSMVAIGGPWGTTEILFTVDVPRTVWEMIDAPEEWVGTLSAVKRVRVGSISTSYWMTTYDEAGNDMQIGD